MSTRVITGNTMQNPYAKTADTYKTQQIQTASREEILVMLYEGAIRFLNKAKEGQAEGNIEKSHTNIMKCQRILTEFMNTLDIEAGGEVAQNLLSLYEYMHRRLVQANVKRDPVILEEVLGHLRQLKATWEKAIKIANQEKAGQRGAENVYSA